MNYTIIKKIHQSFAIIAISTVLVLFVGPNAMGGGQQVKESAEKIHWNFLNAVPYAEDWYKQVLDPYMINHPDQSYEFSSVPWEEYYGRLSAAAAAESELDVLFLDGSIVLSLIALNALLDLTDIVGDTSAFRLEHPAYIYVKDDRLYGLAMDGLDLMAIYYNKDIFNKYGIELPDTYEDMVMVSKTLRQNGIGPLLTVGSPAARWKPIWDEMLIQLTDEPAKYVLDILDGKRKYTDPEALEAYRWIKRFNDDGVWVDNISAIDENTATNLFVTGKAAMFHSGTWAAPMLKKAIAGNFRLGVTHWPFLTPEKRLGASGGFALGIGIYSKISDIKLQPAIDLVKYMTSKEVTKKLTELDDSPLASRKDVIPQMDLVTKEFLPLVDVTVTWLSWLIDEELKETHQTNIQAVAGNLISPEVAAQNVQNVVK